ncbi:MAG: NUDIX domain-containing protein [Acidimicrobiales bacterium]
MGPADDIRAITRGLIADVAPHDTIEKEHLAVVLGWIDSGAALWRTAKPATPPMHLVSYAVVIDPGTDRVLLVDHRLAGLWLPTGGHVEPGEHPAHTSRRELGEELGISPDPHPRVGDRPLLVTVTTTVGTDTPHDDVSLWFAFIAPADTPIRPDPGEFVDTRWWPIGEIEHRPGTRFDPHLPRFLEKLTGGRT